MVAAGVENQLGHGVAVAVGIGIDDLQQRLAFRSLHPTGQIKSDIIVKRRRIETISLPMINELPGQIGHINRSRNNGPDARINRSG